MRRPSIARADATPTPSLPAPTGPSSEERKDPWWVTPATYLVLVGLGAVLGCIGAFLVPLHLGRHVVPLSVALAGVGNFAAGRYGAAATASRGGAAMPALGWLGVVSVLGSARPEGDVVVTGDAVGLAFLAVGALAALAAVGWAPGRASPGRPTGR